MGEQTKYFKDHLVLLLVSINSFLAVASILFILIRLLSSSHVSGYIVQYRPSLGVNSYQTGGGTQLIAFMLFAALALGINITLSIRAYKIHRQLAVAILSLGILLIVLSIIISNALLYLR